MASGTGLFKALISAIPPEIPECVDAKSKARHYQWRRAVFIFLLIFTATLTYALVTYATEAVVDIKVAAAVTPIAAQVRETAGKLDSLNAQVTATNRLLIAKLASDLEDKIVMTQAQRCKAKTEEGVKFFRELVNDFLARYKDLTGDTEKRAPTCAEAS